MKQGENNLDDILGLMEELEGKVNARGNVDSFSINEYNRIVNKFDEISINISNRKIKIGEQTQSRLDELSDIMTSIANLDFSKRAYISKENNHLDYLATGLNLISFHLEKAIKPLLACKDTLQEDSQGIFIIDATGHLIFHNKMAKKLLGLKPNESPEDDLSYLLEKLSNLSKTPTELKFTFNQKKGGSTTLHVSAKKIVNKKGGVTYFMNVPVSKNLNKCDKMLEVLSQIKSALEDKSKLELVEYFWLNQITQLLQK